MKVVTRDEVVDPDWEKEYENEESNFDDPDVSDDKRTLVYDVFKMS